MDNLANLRKMSDSFAERVFDLHINQDNQMSIYMFLLGKGIYKVESFPGAGHNYGIVLESIYDYYKRHPNVDVAEILKKSLSVCAKHLTTPEEFVLIMNYIFKQLENQKNNDAPFIVDVLEVLNVLRTRINSYDKIKNNDLFVEQINKSEQYLEKNYNHKIL